jgi:hypothetical protein
VWGFLLKKNILQAGVIILFIAICPEKFYWASILLLSAIVLRIVSIEFWNQWMMLSLNLLFLSAILGYIPQPDVYNQ